ncbi:MAG: hypothetical protein H7Y36_01095 [Armatimonadetes bacterium]|nr:hypothetical protein [Akkermansiaceae bacterium]
MNPRILVPLVMLLIFGVVMSSFLRNPSTPAGYVGYLTQGAVVGKTKFHGTQSGPTSSGLRWLLSVTNISVTPYTYTEEFEGSDSVLSRDNLKISFRVHIIWKIRPDQVKAFVEKFSTIRDNDNPDAIVQTAYDNFIREPLRTYARDEVQKLDGLEIKDSISPIGDSIFQRTLKLTANTPFEVTSIVVGNIQYPAEVADAVSKKLAATQLLEQKKTEIEIQRRDSEKKVIEAEGIAKAMNIINLSLTGAYLQHEAIEAQKAMVGSPNHTTIYIPTGAMGVPIVGSMNISPPAPEK